MGVLLFKCRGALKVLRMWDWTVACAKPMDEVYRPTESEKTDFDGVGEIMISADSIGRLLDGCI